MNRLLIWFRCWRYGVNVGKAYRAMTRLEHEKAAHYLRRWENREGLREPEPASQDGITPRLRQRNIE